MCTHPKLRTHQHTHTGADDFLPILIFVTIHANPPKLASNLEYIQRYRMQSRMMAEAAYFFTQMVCFVCVCVYVCVYSVHVCVCSVHVYVCVVCMCICV